MNLCRSLGLIVACCLAATAGCGRSGANTSTTPGSAAEATAGSETEVATTLAALTQSVRKFAAEQRQAPATLEELVAKGYLAQVPAAPEGKRYVISKTLEVSLADR